MSGEIRELNPTAINAEGGAQDIENTELLDLFLKQQEFKNKNPNFFRRLLGPLIGKKTKTFKKGKVFTAHRAEGPVEITLTHDITSMPIKVKTVGKKIPAYIVTDPAPDFLGTGAKGSVVTTVGILKRENGVLEFKNKKSYVDKIQDHGGSSQEVAWAKREAELLQKVHPEAKGIMVEKLPFFGVRSHILDKKYGIRLTDLIENPQLLIQSPNDQARLLEKMLLVTINFLRRLEEIHAHGIIHHDLWPNNILVDPVTCEVTIIDFGSAKHQNEFIQNGGKKRFVAPEKFWFLFKKVDQRSDIYSAGLALLEFWGGTGRGSFSFLRNFLESIKQFWMLLFARSEDNISMSTIESKVSIDPPKLKKALLTILKDMLQFDPEKRELSLADIATAFEGIRLHLLHPDREDLRNANTIASRTCSDLIQFAARRAMLFGKDKSENQAALLSLGNTLVESVQLLGDSPDELKEFIAVTGIKRAFQNTATKQDLIMATQTIVADFTQHSADFVALHNRVAAKITLLTRMLGSKHPYVQRLKITMTDMYYLLHKMESHRIHLDDLLKINKHCARKLQGFQSTLADVENLVATSPLHFPIAKPKTLRKTWEDRIFLRILFPPVLLWDLLKLAANKLFGKMVGRLVLPAQGVTFTGSNKTDLALRINGDDYPQKNYRLTAQIHKSNA